MMHLTFMCGKMYAVTFLAITPRLNVSLNVSVSW